MMTLYQENGFILVIHPQEAVGLWLEENLSKFGHSVTVAQDLAQGLAAYQQEHHHLMIVDLPLMQQESLTEFAQNTPETPVITVSDEVSMDEVLAGLKVAQLTTFLSNEMSWY